MEPDLLGRKPPFLFPLLARLRVSSRPEEVRLVSGGYRAEVEGTQGEVLDYLT